MKKKLLEKIKISNERLLKLIINILQLAEIESDDFCINMEKVNIVEIIETKYIHVKLKLFSKILIRWNHKIYFYITP